MKVYVVTSYAITIEVKLLYPTAVPRVQRSYRSSKKSKPTTWHCSWRVLNSAKNKRKPGIGSGECVIYDYERDELRYTVASLRARVVCLRVRERTRPCGKGRCAAPLRTTWSCGGPSPLWTAAASPPSLARARVTSAGNSPCLTAAAREDRTARAAAAAARPPEDHSPSKGGTGWRGVARGQRRPSGAQLGTTATARAQLRATATGRRGCSGPDEGRGGGGAQISGRRRWRRRRWRWGDFGEKSKRPRGECGIWEFWAKIWEGKLKQREDFLPPASSKCVRPKGRLWSWAGLRAMRCFRVRTYMGLMLGWFLVGLLLRRKFTSGSSSCHRVLKLSMNWNTRYSTSLIL